MKKKFGDDYRVASAYESKALNWPGLKAEDSTALNRFSIFLMRSRYCTEAHHEVTFQYEKNMAPFGGHYGNRRTLCYVSQPCGVRG